MSDFDDAAPETWTVVHGPRVAVRGAPSTDAPCVGLRKRGDVLEPLAVVDGWLQLAAGQYVLIDGAPLGFGPLVARDGAALTLRALNPHDGTPFCDVACAPTTTILEVRRKIAATAHATTGKSLTFERVECGRGPTSERRVMATAQNRLRAGDGSLLPSRGASGAAFEPFRDGDTVAACGLRDGDVVGVRYDGDAGFDLGLRRAPGRRVMYRHDADGFPIYDDAATPRFWIDNGSFVARLVVDFMLAKGWEPATDERGRFVRGEDATRDFFSQTDFCYIRSAKRFGGDVAPLDHPLKATPSLSARHLVNHFPGEDALTCKARLALALMRHVKRPRHPATCVCKRSSPRGSPDVAFAVVGGDLGSVLAAAAAPGGEAVVIVKPSRGACGRGIKVFRLEAATDALEEALKSSFGDTREVVVQSYVARPLLLDDGRKFDVRCYLLIVSLPLRDREGGADRAGLLCYFHEGYLRASGRPFPGVGAAGGGRLVELDREAHVTNHTFQKKIEGYDADADAVGDGSLRLPWAALGDVVERRTAKTRRGLDASFRDAVADAVGAALKGDRGGSTRARSNRTDFLSDDWRPGQFAFLGVDFIVDDAGEPYLIEFSKGPGIRDTPQFLYDQNVKLIPDMLAMVLAARGHWLQAGPVDFGCGGRDGDPADALADALDPVRGGWVRLQRGDG